MGATAFARWLGTPSTLCLLRRPAGVTSQCISTSHRYADSCHARSRSAPAPTGFGNHTFRQVCCKTGTPKDTTQIIKDIDERATRALWEHADVAARRAHAQPMLVQKESRQDARVWIEELERRQRLDGFAGIHDVWKGMRYREIDLPVTGHQADTLWSTLIDAVGPEPNDAHHALRRSLLEHAKDLYTRSGIVYTQLYRLLMRCAFRTRSRNYISEWHNDFMHNFGVSNIDLRTLASDFAATQNHRGCQRGFRAVYEPSDQRDLYDSFMTALLLTGDDRFALYWHRQFVKNGDGPSAEMFATAEVQRLFRLDEDKALPMVHRKPVVPASTSLPAAQFPPLTRASMSSMVGEVHGIRPKEVSDTFVAKLFATHAFPLDMLLRGLGFFSIERLGSLALHELAIRAGSRGDLKQRLHDLKTAGIEVEGSVYGKVLQQVVNDGSDQLFDILMASDQHPEVYEDLKLQGRLMDAFLAEGDLPKAHLALIALSSGGVSSNISAWNCILQHHVKNRQYRSFVSTYQQMQLAGVTVNNHTLVLMRRHFLPSRSRGKRPSPVEPREKENKRPLQSMTNVCIYAAQNGTAVHHSIWAELLKRCGMMHRFNELEHLIRWLVSWYSSKPKRSYSTARRQVERPQLPLIFTKQMLQAVVTWGFKDAAERRLLSNKNVGLRRLTLHGHCERWAQGVMLLKQLNTQGLYIAPATVRNALLDRLWILFGPAWSSKASNEQYKRENELSLAHYVEHADDIWDQKLFKVRPELLRITPDNTAKLMITIFGPTRRASLNRKEVADVVAYARTIGHRRLNFSRNGIRRFRAWYYSPFRHPAPTNAKSIPHRIIPRAPHQSPSAHSMNSHRPPNPANTPEHPSPYSPSQQSARPT